jgi:hypothetical protein
MDEKKMAPTQGAEADKTHSLNLITERIRAELAVAWKQQVRSQVAHIARIEQRRAFYLGHGLKLTSRKCAGLGYDLWYTNCPLCGVTSRSPKLSIDPIKGDWRCEGFCRKRSDGFFIPGVDGQDGDAVMAYVLKEKAAIERGDGAA